MFLKPFFAIALLVSLCGVVSTAAVGTFKRQTNDVNFQLYAYGTNINGLPVFYGDGVAYIGTTPPSGVAESVNITFTPSSADATTWPVSPNNTIWSSSPILYINPSSGAFDSVGFANTTGETLPDGAITSGFTFYGHNVMYQDSTGIMQAKFWATKTSQAGVWVLKWNSDGARQDNSVPVAIKSTPPVTISSV